MDYKKIGDELKKKLQEIKISRDKLNSKDFYKDSDNLSTLKPPKKVIDENIFGYITIYYNIIYFNTYSFNNSLRVRY